MCVLFWVGTVTPFIPQLKRSAPAQPKHRRTAERQGPHGAVAGEVVAVNGGGGGGPRPARVPGAVAQADRGGRALLRQQALRARQHCEPRADVCAHQAQRALQRRNNLRSMDTLVTCFPAERLGRVLLRKQALWRGTTVHRARMPAPTRLGARSSARTICITEFLLLQMICATHAVLDVPGSQQCRK